MARQKNVKPTDPQTIRVMLKGTYNNPRRFSGYDFEGTPDAVIEMMTALKAEYPDKKLVLDWQQEQYDDSYSLFVMEERLETPEEVAERLKRYQSFREQQEAHERAEFERLSKKFDK